MFRSFALAAAMLAAMPALAEPAVPGKAITIKTADLDLGTPAGRRLLRSRLALAAAEVCGSTDQDGVVAPVTTAICRREAVRNAQRQVAGALRLAARTQGNPPAIRS